MENIKVEFMTANGFWRRSGMHENNIKKGYNKFKVNRHFDYYRSDDNDMIYRITHEEEKCVMAKDVITDFTIIIRANMQSVDKSLFNSARFTKLAFDSAKFPVHIEEFKASWSDLMNKAKYTKLSEL